MSRRSWALLICGGLLIANIAFIWGNSALPGSVSREVSGNAMNWAGFLVAAFGEFGEKVLRKLAHLAEFTSLGFLLAAFCRLLGQKGFALSALAGLMIACVDETIQLYTPNRACSILDVWLDFFGVILGIIVLLIGYFLLRKRKLITKSEEI